MDTLTGFVKTVLFQ